VIVQPHASAIEAFERVRPALERPLATGSAPAGPVARRLREELDAPDTLSSLAIDALCLELLVLAARAGATCDRKPPRWLARVVEYLRAHARDPVTLARAAEVGGVHPAHLAREFRVHYRTSVGSYVRGLRLAWAAERLASTNAPIAEVAVEAGFADQSHFTRAFRRYSGLTPRAFRDARITD